MRGFSYNAIWGADSRLSRLIWGLGHFNSRATKATGFERRSLHHAKESSNFFDDLSEYWAASQPYFITVNVIQSAHTHAGLSLPNATEKRVHVNCTIWVTFIWKISLYQTEHGCVFVTSHYYTIIRLGISRPEQFCKRADLRILVLSFALGRNRWCWSSTSSDYVRYNDTLVEFKSSTTHVCSQDQRAGWLENPLKRKVVALSFRNAVSRYDASILSKNVFHT